MAFSLNRIELIGHLGADAETRFTNSNASVTSFSLATVHSFKRNEQWENETTWHNIIAWSLSDFMKEALKKGKKFYVEGRLSKREYADKDGIKRYAVEVVAEKIIPLENNGNSSNGNSGYSSNSNSGQSNSRSMNTVDENDDLPF